MTQMFFLVFEDFMYNNTAIFLRMAIIGHKNIKKIVFITLKIQVSAENESF